MTSEEQAALDEQVARLMGWEHYVSPVLSGGALNWWKRDGEDRDDCPPYASAAPGSDEAAILGAEMERRLLKICKSLVTIHLHPDGTARVECAPSGECCMYSSYHPKLEALARAVVAAEKKGATECDDGE